MGTWDYPDMAKKFKVDTTLQSAHSALPNENPSGSLLRGLEIIKCFRPGRAVLGNGDIAAATGLPKATVSRLTRALWQAGYLVYDRDAGKFSLGATLLSFGFTFLSNMPILHVAHEPMQQLANFSGGAVSLAYPDRVEMIYIDRCTSETMPYFLGIGASIDMVRTAAGRAYIAALEKSKREELLGRLASHHKSDWAHLLPRIEEAIRQVAERGFCVVDGEWQRNVRAVASPLLFRDGRTVLTINCAVASYAATVDRLNTELGPRIHYLSRTLSLQF